MAVDIEITGLDELMSKLEAIGQNAGKATKAALEAAAQPIAEDMRKSVSVSNITDPDHVHIRDDIEISGVKTKDGVKYVIVGPGKETVWRAKLLEWGTVKMAAKPFVQPAGERHAASTPEIISNVLRGFLKL